MAFLQIRKKYERVWLHISDTGEFMISKFYFKLDDNGFQIIERGGARRFVYSLSEITVYDDINGGSAETFTTAVALYLRLVELKYTGIENGQDIPQTLTLEQARQNGNIFSGEVVFYAGNGFKSTSLDGLVENHILFDEDGNIEIGSKNIDDSEINKVKVSPSKVEILKDLYIDGNIISDTETTSGSIITDNHYSIDKDGFEARQEDSNGHGRLVIADVYNGFSHSVEDASGESNIEVSAKFGVSADKYFPDKEEFDYPQMDDIIPRRGTEAGKNITGRLIGDSVFTSKTNEDFAQIKDVNDKFNSSLAPQVEVSGNQNSLPAWNGKEVTLTSSGTLTITNASGTLPEQFNFTLYAETGVTIAWAIASPYTWRVAGLTVGTAPPSMTSGQFCQVSRRIGTNEIKVLGL